MSDQGPDAKTNHILLVLSTFMDMDGRGCFPSVDTLAACSKRSPSTVRAKLKKAAKEGWIGRFTRMVGTKQTSNGYVAKIPEGVTTRREGAGSRPLPPS